MGPQERPPLAGLTPDDGASPRGLYQGAAEVLDQERSCDPEELVQVNVRVEKQLRKAIKRAALEEDVTINEWMTSAVLQKLAR